MSDNLFIPNSTQVPNIIIDFLMAYLPEAEFKVLCYIYRRTFGFNKQGDYISLKQIGSGLVTRAGKRLDSGTGLSKPSNIKALSNLSRLNIITTVKTRKVNYYKPNLDIDIEFILNKIPDLKKEEQEKMKEKFRQMKLF